MESISHLLIVIAVLSGVTFLTRALPFMLLYKVAEHPTLVYLGRYLPPVLMVLLVLYTFKDVDFSGAGLAPELLGISLVTVLHLCFRQPLLSIVGGTALYMVLLQGGLLGG
ncbi:MAG: AzlD domain-containing protein [Motiliproteus sp.]